jgi:hypothetical protein
MVKKKRVWSVQDNRARARLTIAMCSDHEMVFLTFLPILLEVFICPSTGAKIDLFLKLTMRSEVL